MTLREVGSNTASWFSDMIHKLTELQILELTLGQAGFLLVIIFAVLVIADS